MQEGRQCSIEDFSGRLGSLIAPDIVLSAAHCLHHKTPKEVIFYTEKGAVNVRFGKSIRFREDYLLNYDSFLDVALLKLNEPILDASIYDLFSGTLQKGEAAVAVGVSDNMEQRNEIAKRTGQFKFAGEIKKLIFLGTDETETSLLSGAIPVFESRLQKQQNLCKKDSGGPIFVVRDGKKYIAGIASVAGIEKIENAIGYAYAHKKNCSDWKMSGYAPVVANRDWIRENFAALK